MFTRFLQHARPLGGAGLGVILALGAGVTAGLAGEPVTGSSATGQQQSPGSVAEAQEWLLVGDKSYEAGDFRQATESYAKALAVLPDSSPELAGLRTATRQRLGQAAAEQAREQVRLGDVPGARQTVEGVLAEGVAPDSIEARTALDEIDDPIRTNPALTAEHARDVDEVRRLLYTAEGAYQLGDYDRAKLVYEDVLRIDPTNKAARRGMETLAAAKSDYYRAAYDESRAAMLAEVDAQWELQVPPLDLGVAGIGYGADEAPAGIDYVPLLRSMRIPVLDFDDTTLGEAIDYLRIQTIELDHSTADPTARGINFVLDVTPEEAAQTLSLTLRDAPLEEVLRYLTQTTGTSFAFQPFAVVIRSADKASEEMMIRSYRVPPDFLSAAGGPSGEATAANDPFAAPQEGGLLARRLSAQEVLEARGVSFPEGATAAFNAGNSTLRVRNTVANHLLIEQAVALLANEEPTSVVVEVKVIKTEQRTLEELSFDWLLGSMPLGGDNKFLTGGTRGNGGDLGDVAYPGDDFSGAPITSGNRSGNSAFTGNAIDQRIQEAVFGFRDTSLRAPGALWLGGVVNEAAFGVLMRGLDQKTGVDFSAVPSVVTRSGQQASVRIIEEFIYPTEYEPPEIPNSVGSGPTLLDLDTGIVEGGTASSPITPATPTSFEMRETGIILEVLPTVSKDKRFVDISLVPDITNFDGFINYGSPITAGGGGYSIVTSPGGSASLVQNTPTVITPNLILMPVFSRMRTTTNLTVADGATIVMSGLLQDNIEEIEDKTPILGDIPVVGRLFQSKGSQPIKKAIVFMVTVKVVDAAGQRFNP